MTTKCFKQIGLFAVLASCAGAAIAHDDDDARALRGDYGFTSSQSCVRTPFQRPPAAGFDPVSRQLLVQGEVVDAVSMGVFNFKKDGTVTVRDGVQTEILENQIAAGQIPVAANAEFSCSGTYALQPGDKINVELSCNVKPPQPGLTVTLAPLSFSGYVTQGKHSILLSSVKANLQTVTVAAGPTVLQERQRFCVQSATLGKL